MSNDHTTTVLPPGPRAPRIVQGAAFLLARRHFLDVIRKRHGPTFSASLPLVGSAVVTSEPELIKQLFQTNDDVVGGAKPNLGDMFGPGSMFSLRGEEHQRRRKLLVPPFHGKRMRAYEDIVAEETLREIATWPEGREFPVMPSMMRITINVILRAVFGAQGAQLDSLRVLLPRMISLASRLAPFPWARVDLGPRSPWGRVLRYREQLDAEIEALIATAHADPDFAQRSDVLSLMLQARYEDGTSLSHSDIADEMLTLLTAGHETTATTLAWAVERIRRHPDVLRRLVEEVDADGIAYRQATIYEIQRTRPVIAGFSRRVEAPTVQLGPWTLPRGTIVMIGIGLIHADDDVFPDSGVFDPDRFADTGPGPFAWIPFGGGRRRCIGAAFANMEMNVVLRTMLRELDLGVTDAPGERWHSRGVTSAPADGGLVTVRRRRATPDTPRIHDDVATA